MNNNSPPNAFFAAQDEVRKVMNKQRRAQVWIAKGLKAIADAQAKEEPPSDLNGLATISTQLEKINNTLERLDRTETDYVTAIYAAVVDTSGIIVDRTNAGQWIIDAWKAVNSKMPPPTIFDIGGLNDGRKLNAYRKVVDVLVASRDLYPGLPQHLVEADIRRFIRLAPGVCEAIAALQVPTPGASPSTK